MFSFLKRPLGYSEEPKLKCYIPQPPIEWEQITNLKDLQQHLGKVVKYTCDDGKSWNYVFLDKALYKVEGKQVIQAGINAFPTQKDWLQWKISSQIIIDDKMFDPCLNGHQKIYFQTVEYSEFEHLTFSHHGYLSRSYASKNGKVEPTVPTDIVCKAPLTLVRSEQADVDLKISLIFNQNFKLVQPTYPQPKEEPLENNKQYSWNVHVNQDRTLDVSGADSVERVRLIWWEAARNNLANHKSSAPTVIIHKNDIGSFMKEVLTKKGVLESEQEAFIKYWQECFANDPQVTSLKVRLIDKEENKILKIAFT